jgi:hypothetical protein
MRRPNLHIFSRKLLAERPGICSNNRLKSGGYCFFRSSGRKQLAIPIKEGQYMSRIGTTPQQSTPSGQSMPIPHEKIAMRAYEKWVKRGRPQGSDRQDWLEAEAELRSEVQRSGGTSQPFGRR